MAEKPIDCKHGTIKGTDDTSVYFCKEPNCSAYFRGFDVIILTKAQYQLMQDVIEQGKSVEHHANTFNDGGYTVYAVEYEAMRRLIGALKDLKGKSNVPK